jgi:hypothetical protein
VFALAIAYFGVPAGQWVSLDRPIASLVGLDLPDPLIALILGFDARR